MKLTILDVYCLNALCDDYENITTIMADVSRAANTGVPFDEIERCLRRLEIEELVTAFEYDIQKTKYIPSSHFEGKIKEKWYFITEKGRQELDSNWIE